MLKAVILVGGPQKGTRFRPLSLDTPKPLFPIAGLPLIQHHIAACANLVECREVLIIGSYPTTTMAQFVSDMQKEYPMIIRYLQEFTPLGTGGALYHFRDQVRAGNPSAFFLLNGDVCADFPLKELLAFHEERPNALVSIMGTEATRQQSLHYGCMVRAPPSMAVTHYVEKPGSYVSTLINCGVYACSLQVFHAMDDAFQRKQGGFYWGGGGAHPGCMSWEQDVVAQLAGAGRLFALLAPGWWAQVKTAGSALYANRRYLRGSSVYVHPSAQVHPSAVVGPNVSVGARVQLRAGVRVREAILLDDAEVHEHALVVHAVVGRGASVGRWARVEGTPADPDPNKPFAKMDNTPLFNCDGRLNPSVAILGSHVAVPAETILLNSIVLPHKQLTRSYKHEIIL